MAFAQHDCTRQVVHSDGSITITTDCSATNVPGREQGEYRVPYYLGTLESNLLNNANGGSQSYDAQSAASTTSTQVNPQQVATESQTQAQQAIDAEQEKQQEEKDKLDDYKQQHSM